MKEIIDAHYGLGPSAPKLRIYCGPKESGTHHLSKEILRQFAPPDDPNAYKKLVAFEEMSFNEAAAELVKDPDLESTEEPLRIAIFAGGVQTPAVRECFLPNPTTGEPVARLVSLKEANLAPLWGRMEIGHRTPDGTTVNTSTIPKGAYYSEQKSVETIEIDVLLLCRSGLDLAAGTTILENIHDNLSHLLWAVARHSSPARRSRLVMTLPSEAEMPLTLHEATKSFSERMKDQSVLVFATGSPWGSYHETAMTIKNAMPDGTKMMLIPTDASSDNVVRIGRSEASIAIVQLDVAMAAYFNSSSSVYRTQTSLPSEWAQIDTENFRRIAFLENESLFIFANRDVVSDAADHITFPEFVRLFENKKPPTLLLGPELSGTAMLARAAIEHSSLESADFILKYDSFDHLSRSIRGREVDVVFVVGTAESIGVSQLLNDPQLQLLSLGKRPAGNSRTSGFLRMSSLQRRIHAK